MAYFSDASGEYQLFIRDQNGLGAPKVIDLGPDPSFFYSPRWSPDSKHVAYADKHLHLWYVDVDGGKPVKIDTAIRGSFNSPFGNLSWSPDSKWVAYTRDLENQLNAVFFYSLETHASTQITDGMSDAQHPVFDPNGKFVYFTASTDNGPSSAGIDLSSLDRATTSSPYVIVLKRYGASPVPPESDDEKGKDEKKEDDEKDKKDKSADDKKDDAKPADAKPDDKKDADKKDADKKDDKPVEVKIDLEGIGNRILSLPVPARNYLDVQVGKTGVLYLAEGPPVGRPSGRGGPQIRSLWRFTTEKRDTDELLRGIDGFAVSANGEKLLYGKQDNWFMATTSDMKPAPPTPRKASRSTWAPCRPSSIRALSGSRCTTRRGASSATSSTTRTPTASAFQRSRRSTSHTLPASPRARSSLISPKKCSEKSASATCSSAALKLLPTNPLK